MGTESATGRAGGGSGAPDIRLGVERGCCQPATEMRTMSVGQGEMSLLVGFSAPPLPPQVTDRHAWRRRVHGL